MGGGNGHGPQLVECQHGNPPLEAALQDEHDHVAAADAELLQVGSSLVAALLHVGKGESDLCPMFVGPEHGLLVGMLGRPYVHHIIAEVEILWNDKL